MLANPKVPNRKEIVAGIAKMPEPQAGDVLGSFVEKTPGRDCDLDTALAQVLAGLHDARVIPTLQRINFDGWKKDGCYTARIIAAQALSQRGARPFPEEKEDARVP